MTPSESVATTVSIYGLSDPASPESTVITPLKELIVIPVIFGANEYVKAPVPFVAAVVPPPATNALDDAPIPVVVMIAEPPVIVIPSFIRTCITADALALTESVTVTVSV